MRRFSFLISKYVLQAVLPYFIFTWLLISVILFVQQASRYSDLLFNTSLPNVLIWQLAIALIPNVIAFTCPVAILIGVIIGLSRMQGDSEMVALRAAGVGNLQITLPVLFLGILLSVFAFSVNLKGVPIAAQIVRQVALKAALYKLESPIDPGVFNSEINDFTIYVKNGNIEEGTWENIFIYQEDKTNKQVRLITSKEGGIDSSGENSEIVLKNAFITTFEPDNEDKIIVENIKDFRLVVKTKRGELIDRIAKTKETPEEMGLRELSAFSQTLDGNEKTEAEILLQRRLILSITPIIFALLGAALVAKFNRGGRGFGVFLSLFSLILYYLITLLGEQLARTGSINVITAGLIPIISSIVLIAWLFVTKRLKITKHITISNFFTREKENNKNDKISSKNSLIDLTTGILDFDIALSLIKNYLLTFGFLTSIYLIFTAFELWKFAGTIDNGIPLLFYYLLYLIPFIYIQLAPSALMITSLATYIIKSRQNEVVTWTAAGLSIYRILMPCFMFMIVIGFVNFGIQELVLTKTNRIQDALRTQIRNRNAEVTQEGKIWGVNNNKIYSYEKAYASDNDKNIVNNLRVFEFNNDNSKLNSMISVDKAYWNDKQNELNFMVDGKKSSFNNGIAFNKSIYSYDLLKGSNPFKDKITKPTHLNITETISKIENAESIQEKRTYSISLQKKYATPFLPFIIILFTTPFSLSLGRKGNVVTIGYAVAVWLFFMGSTNIFEQFGQSGFIPPAIAIWGPLMFFSIIGTLLLTRVKT